MKGIYLKEPEPYRLLKAENICFYAHFHQQVEVVYCICGEVPMLVDGYSYTLSAGDMALVFPNQHHYYQPVGEGGGNQIYLLLFYPSHVEGFYTEWLGKLPRSPVLRCSQLPQFYAQLWDQFYGVHEDNQELYLFKAYASLLMAHAMPLLKLFPLHSSKALADSQQEAMQAVLNYVDQHFTEKITLASVARELGFSCAALSRTFSRTVGSSFPEHVNSLRISYAKRLLRSSKYSINEISYLSGFQSKRTFFHNFQESCGMTPGEYRRECRK